MTNIERIGVVGCGLMGAVPVLDLVELVQPMLTGPDVEERAGQFATERLGKKLIRS